MEESKNNGLPKGPPRRRKLVIDPAMVKVGVPVPLDVFEVAKILPAVPGPGPAPAPKPKPVEPKPKPAAAVVVAEAEAEAIPVAEDRLPITDESIASLRNALVSEMDKPRLGINPKYYYPPTRRAFKQFIIQSYKEYKLPPLPDEPDPEACEKAISSSSDVKMFAYQSFVRDYIQRASPYRGILVYHGLGSGKTCTSIACMEALNQLYQMDTKKVNPESLKPIYVMTPASLDPNFRDELTKCGPLIFRTMNHWVFVPIKDFKVRSGEGDFLLKTLGLLPKMVKSMGGAWVPDPTKPPNFDALPVDHQAQIRSQIKDIIEKVYSRIKFVHYNGLQLKTLVRWACNEDTRHVFDGATIVIDEVHNLIRTINNSNLERMYAHEPFNMAEYVAQLCKTPSKYKISYLLYRMLCNSVGSKIIALSATPIINFPQEIGILANILGGDTRIAEVNTPILRDEQIKKVLEVLHTHGEVDFAEVLKNVEGSKSRIRFTAIPSGYNKVLDPKTKQFRGFVKDERLIATSEYRERRLSEWYSRVGSAISAGAGITLGTPNFYSAKRLIDTKDEFKTLFIDGENLEVKKEVKFTLLNRLSGLISYYKGGKQDYMARVIKDEIVYVEMSDNQLKKYTDERYPEIDREKKQAKKKAKPAAIGFEEVTQSISSTFKIFSRAACNFAFPKSMDRPKPADFRDVINMVGKEKDINITSDEVLEEAPAVVAEPETEAEEEETQVVSAKEAVENASNALVPMDYKQKLVDVVKYFNSNLDLFRRENLHEMSPKFQAIIDRIVPSKGPVLVYSNFKTLEGVGLFGIALEAQLGLKKFDLVEKGGGGYDISPEIASLPVGTSFYISYTGDEARDKRKLMLDIFNGKWNKVPSEIVSKVKALTGASDNKEGKIVKVFMITQSGAEGISLANVRQVHIMEPFWNYVRLDQVKGRAIRICSHMTLPVDQRTVEVYTYITKFAKSQMVKGGIDETLLIHDSGKTTDEYIYELLIKKKKLADSILDLMKLSAVDCELNATENGAVACYTFKTDATTAPTSTFHPYLMEDLKAPSEIREK